MTKLTSGVAAVQAELEYKPWFFGGLMVTGILNAKRDVKIPSMYDGEAVRALIIEEEEQWDNVATLSIEASCEIAYRTLEIIVNKGIFLIYNGDKEGFEKLFPIPVSQELAEIGLGYTKEEVQNLRYSLKYIIIDN